MSDKGTHLFDKDTPKNLSVYKKTKINKKHDAISAQ